MNIIKKTTALLLLLSILVSFTGVTAFAEGPTVISLGLQTSSNITDYEDNYLTQLLEQEGNVDLQLEYLPADGGDVKNKLAMMISGGSKLPDVILSTALDNDTILDYGSKGVVLALDEYLGDEALAQYVNQIPEEDREKMLNDIRSADGHIYGLPYYIPSAWSSTNKRMWINTQWLEKLNLQMPTTTDELYTVLEAFVNNDPNGNGIADEIGLYGKKEKEIILALMNSFVYCSSLTALALDEQGNKVTAPFTTDEYREGLRWFNKLYKNGLLNENLFTDDQTTLVANMNTDINFVGVTALGSFPTLWPNSALGLNKNVGEYDMLAPQTGPGGLAYAPHVLQEAKPRWFITKDAANPEAAFALGDLHYRRDIGLAARYGKPENIITDLDVIKEAGWTNSYMELGIVDEILLRTEININATQTNEYWRDYGPRYAPAIFDLSYSAIVENDDTTSNVSTFHGKNYLYNVDARPQHLLPTLKHTLEELDQISDIRVDINEYINQCVAQFILGGMDIETEWDAYVAELDRLGLATYIEVAQAAYERAK